jgi:hypothetical protein
VPGSSLDQKGGSRYHLLLSKRLNLPTPFFVEQTRHCYSEMNYTYKDVGSFFAASKCFN